MSIKPNKFGNNYDIIEGDLDPLAVRVLEDKLGLKPGILTKYNLIDWKYIPDKKEMLLIFKKGFDWPYNPYEMDPRNLNRKKSSEYLSLTLIIFDNIYE